MSDSDNSVSEIINNIVDNEIMENNIEYNKLYEEALLQCNNLESSLSESQQLLFLRLEGLVGKLKYMELKYTYEKGYSDAVNNK